MSGLRQLLDAAIELRHGLGQTSRMQPSDASADLRQDFAEQGDAALLADTFCFLSASLQGIGIAEIAEQLRAERQRKGQVERMTAAPRIGFHGPVRRQRLIWIAHHPEQLAAIDAVTGHGVGVGECRESPMSLRIVELEDLITGAEGLGKFAEPVVAGGGGAVTEDFKAIVAELSAGLGEVPAQRSDSVNWPALI